ncbi:MAG: PQ-loop repeat-containing protein [Candidatus Thermoplasmatota archaeon]
MDAWEVLNIVGSLGFVACLTPQMIRTVRLRRADDLSQVFLLLVLFSSICILIYSLQRNNLIFAAAQGANLVVWGTVLYFKMRPGPRPTT